MPSEAMDNIAAGAILFDFSEVFYRLGEANFNHCELGFIK